MKLLTLLESKKLISSYKNNGERIVNSYNEKNDSNLEFKDYYPDIEIKECLLKLNDKQLERANKEEWIKYRISYYYKLYQFYKDKA
jgi:hypothetical protein